MSKLPQRRKTAVVRVNGVDIREYGLSELEAAKFLELSVSWLQKSRQTKPLWVGPKYVVRDGYHIKYRQSDLEHFLATRNGGPKLIDPAERMAKAAS